MKKDKKNILFVSHSSGRGGAETVLIDVLHHFSAKNVVYLFTHRGDNENLTKNKDVKKIYIVSRFNGAIDISFSILNLFMLPFGSIKNILRLIRIIENNNIDVVITNTSTIFYASVAAKLCGKKHVLIIHEIISNSLFRKLFFFINEKLSERIVFVSKACESAHSYSKKSTVLTPSIEKEKFEILSSIEHVNRGEKIIISMVGRIYEVKGVDFFVDVAEKILQLNGDMVQFRIYGEIGDKNYYQKLEKRIKKSTLEDAVKFMGFENILNILIETDVLLLTSRNETGPLVVQEAMSAGIPVVAFNVGNVSEYISNGINGYIVDGGDVDAMVKNLSSLLNSSDEIKRIGEAAKDFMKKRRCSNFYEELEKIILT